MRPARVLQLHARTDIEQPEERKSQFELRRLEYKNGVLRVKKDGT